MFLTNRRFREAAIVSTLAFASVAVQAETIAFRARLDAASEVPAKTSDGKGMVRATLNTDTDEFTYHIVFSGLTGPATAAHFHGPAAPGANAGPQVPIKAASIASPLDGTATLTPEQAKDLVDGKWYFNVHTSANPGGEIRGQLVKSGK